MSITGEVVRYEIGRRGRLFLAVAVKTPDSIKLKKAILVDKAAEDCLLKARELGVNDNRNLLYPEGNHIFDFSGKFSEETKSEIKYNYINNWRLDAEKKPS